jgi:hypothetical protein
VVKDAQRGERAGIKAYTAPNISASVLRFMRRDRNGGGYGMAIYTGSRIGAIVLVLVLNRPVNAQSCDQDTIDSIADDGSIIVMTSGASFRVSPLDQTDAMFWLAEDDVLICKDETEIINKNEKRERIRVSRIR